MRLCAEDASFMKIRPLSFSAITIVLWAVQGLTVHAQERPVVQGLVEAEEEAPLLGDHGRRQLSDDGYTIEALAIHDIWGNARGGKYRGVGVLGNFNLILTVDTAKAGWWDDGELVLYGIGVYGRRPSLAVGDYQYTSNVDAFDTVEPYEAYYKHRFLDGSVDVLAGVHDFSIEFSIIDYGFVFINSSFFTPSTITQNPYSFYPFTGLGTRVRADITDDVYLMAGVYDGKPGDFQNPRAARLGLSKREGFYSISEVGWVESDESKPHAKIAFGAWHNSGDFEDINGVGRSSNYGTYLIGERQIWQEVDGSSQGLGAFFQVGQAQADRNFNPWYFGGGLHYKGFFEGRDEDVLGFGYAHAEVSSAFRLDNPRADHSERTFELCYRAQVVRAVTVTPDIQYVVNPSMNPDLANSLIFYLRTEVAL